MRRILLFSLALAWLCSACMAAPVGETLPNFEFKTLNGQTVKLSELSEASPKGLVMLTFWCTTCASCRATESRLADLARRYRSKAKVVAVSSSANDSAADIQAYFKRHSVDLPVILDPDSALGHRLGAQRTTTTVLVGPDGKVLYFGTLVKDKKNYAEDALQEVLGGRRVSTPEGPIYG